MVTRGLTNRRAKLPGSPPRAESLLRISFEGWEREGENLASWVLSIVYTPASNRCRERHRRRIVDRYYRVVTRRDVIARRNALFLRSVLETPRPSYYRPDVTANRPRTSLKIRHPARRNVKRPCLSRALIPTKRRAVDVRLHILPAKITRVCCSYQRIIRYVAHKAKRFLVYAYIWYIYTHVISLRRPRCRL